MKRHDTKSACPVNFTLEILGDQWSLLILRDMMADGKSTFGEFLASEEQIGSSVLAARLASLERNGIISKQTDNGDKRKTRYQLTAKGVELVPVLFEISLWGTKSSPATSVSPEWLACLELDRTTVVAAYQQAVRRGSSFAHGPDSVVRQLGLATLANPNPRAARVNSG